MHHELLSVIRRDLNDKLRPRYVVRIEERVYVSSDSDPGRDVIALEVTTVLEELQEARLEIIDSQGGAIVTVIELLSPANKTPGADGRESYLKKCRDVLKSPTHLVEIDLLRRGRRTFRVDALPPCDYFVHVSPGDRRPKGDVWAIRLLQRLPTIRIPLSSGDRPVSLDLQSCLSQAYANAGYDLTIDYAADPPAPQLSEVDAAWLDQLLKTAQRR